MVNATNRDNILSAFQTNLEDMEISRPYDPFNIMHVSFNGGNRADATDFLQDGLKSIGDPTSYAVYIAGEKRDSLFALQRAVSDNQRQILNRQLLDNIEEGGSEAPVKKKRIQQADADSQRSSTQPRIRSTDQENDEREQRTSTRRASSPQRQESNILTDAYNGAANLVDSAGDTVVVAARAARRNLADAAEAVGGREARLAGRSVLNGDFTGAARHAGNAAGNAYEGAVDTLSRGASSVRSTLGGAATTVTNTVSGWGSGLARTIGWD